MYVRNANLDRLSEEQTYKETITDRSAGKPKMDRKPYIDPKEGKAASFVDLKNDAPKPNAQEHV